MFIAKPFLSECLCLSLCLTELLNLTLELNISAPDQLIMLKVGTPITIRMQIMILTQEHTVKKFCHNNSDRLGFLKEIPVGLYIYVVDHY